MPFSTRGPAAKNQTNQTEPPPATKIEAFKPVEGSVNTLGYDDIGSGVAKMHLDARQIKASDGSSVKGMKVVIEENEFRQESAFIDGDS